MYRGRELLPGVRNRPKKLSLKGHRRFWTWLIPTFKVTDAEFLASAGLDALVSVRILSYGALLFIPIGILGVGVGTCMRCDTAIQNLCICMKYTVDCLLLRHGRQ